MSSTHNRFTAGRFLQAKYFGKGSISNATAFAESQNWLDRAQVVAAIKASVSQLGSGNFPTALAPVADAFMQQLRPYSIPQRLNPRRIPLLTRVLLNTAGTTASLISEGAAIPLRRGSWDSTTLAPKIIAVIE